MSLDDLFSHEIILKSREPHLFEVQQEIRNVNNAPSDQNRKQMQTFVLILEEGCTRVYGDQPIWQQETNETDLLHRFRCIVRDWIGIGIAKDKQSAKHLAAKEILLKIVEAGRHKDFFIQGETMTEAKEYIEKLMPDLENEEFQNKIKENWIGKFNELLAKRKVPEPPTFEYKQSGPPNNVEFSCTVKFFDLKAEDIGKSKNKAKNLAYYKLYHQVLEDWPRIQKLFDATNQKTNEQNETKCGDPNSFERVTPVQNPYELTLAPDFDIKATVEYALKNESMVEGSEILLMKLLNLGDSEINKVFENPVLTFHPTNFDKNLGVYQVYLEIKNKEKERQINTFGGQGPTLELARDHACWQAIEYIYVSGTFD